jgi:hypothetical protein
MNGRHRRELVGVEPGHVRVHRLVVKDGRVDHAGLRQHPRRRDRDELDQQAEAGERDERRAPPAVAIPVPDKQPDQARNQDGKVQRVVVEVEELDQQRMREEHSLERGLARQPDHALEVPDPPGSGKRAARPHDGERASEIPQGEQAQQQSGLLRDHGGSSQARAPGEAHGHASAAQRGRGHRRLRPAQVQVDHAVRPASAAYFLLAPIPTEDKVTVRCPSGDCGMGVARITAAPFAGQSPHALPRQARH